MRSVGLYEAGISFDSKFEPVPECGCWIWTAGVNSQGYGLIKYRTSMFGAHRLSWLLHRGSIPTGAMVCHKCDTPSCVNPDHLFIGTALSNMQDMIAKGRQDFPAGQRHSRAKLTDDQVYAIRASGLHSKEVAIQYGISEPNASQILNRKLWDHLPARSDEATPPPRRIIRGASHPNAKLSEAVALEIYCSCGKPSDVAKQHGCSEALVRRIRSGKAWTHATGGLKS